MPAHTAAQYERRTFPFAEVKALDDAQGTFSGYLAVFNNIDQGGDIIKPGAFAKSLSDLQTKQRSRQSRYILPIFWSHMPEEPLGGFTEAYEDAHGLYVKGELDLDIEQGRRAYSGLKRGYLSGMSIGYITVKQAYEGDARVLKELRLLEGSLTAIPMNEEALVTSVKSACGDAGLPLADRARAWDGAGAHNRIVKWATKEDGTLDSAKMKRAHFWYDESAPDKVTSYKLGFADLINEELTAIPRGIFAVAAVLSGSRGGADLGGDTDAVKAKVAAYYARMAKAFDDDSIVAPWDAGKGAGGKALMAPLAPMDFNTAFTQLSAADALQDEWGDAFQALVSSLYGVMLMGNQPGDSGAQDLADTILKQFTTAMSDLVARSLAAQFTPCLDDDGDSFYDPDGPNAHEGGDDDDDTYAMPMMRGADGGTMSRDTRRTGRKAGRVLSAANHAHMSTALQGMRDAHTAMQDHMKSMQDLLDATKPDAAKPSAQDTSATDGAQSGTGKSAYTRPGAGAGAASTDGALDSSTTPQGDEPLLSEQDQQMLVKVRAHLLAMKLGKGAA